MNANKKFLSLLERLRDATSGGKIEWQETAEEDTFRANIGEFMVRIGQEFSLLGESSYYASFLTSKAKVVDKIVASTGGEIALLSELHGLARRSAFKADDLLNSALSIVDNQLSK
jgi:hypothetical protein